MGVPDHHGVLPDAGLTIVQSSLRSGSNSEGLGKKKKKRIIKNKKLRSKAQHTKHTFQEFAREFYWQREGGVFFSCLFFCVFFPQCGGVCAAAGCA